MTTQENLRTGRLVKQGEFRLDEGRARQKLRNYRLASPHHYILEFVKAAHLFGATSIDVSVERGEVEVEFDASVPSPVELASLYSAAFGLQTDDHRRALRHLAIGVNAAHGAGLRDLTIETGGTTPYGVRITEDEIVELDDVSGSVDGLRIRIEKRLRDAVLARFVRQVVGELEEGKLLRDYTRFSSVDIHLDGEQINDGLLLLDYPDAAKWRYELDGERGVVAVTFDRRYLMSRLVRHGVVVDEDSRNGPFDVPGIRAVVESSFINTDLSQNSVIRDEQWTELQRRIDVGAAHALARMLGNLSEPDIDEHRKLLGDIVVRFLTNDEYSDIVPDELIEVIAGLPLFPPAVLEGEEWHFVSISEAREEVEDPICYSSRRFPSLSDADYGSNILCLRSTEWPFEQLDGPDAIHRFLDDFGGGDDCTDELQLDAWREENCYKWRHRSWSGIDVEPRRNSTVDGLSVIVGMEERAELEEDNDGPGLWSVERELFGDTFESEVYYVKDGRLLSRQSFESRIGTFFVEIAGDLTPNRIFDEPEVTDRLKRAQTKALGDLVDLIEENPFTPRVFKGLLGDFQEKINRAFHWDWSVWPEEITETPLGIAPPMVPLPSPDETNPEARIRIQLERLGPLADIPLLADVNDQPHSLREIYERLYEGPSPEALELVGIREADYVDAVDEESDNLKLVVPYSARDIVRTFFGSGASLESLDVVEGWVDKFKRSEDVTVGEGETDHDAVERLIPAMEEMMPADIVGEEDGNASDSTADSFQTDRVEHDATELLSRMPDLQEPSDEQLDSAASGSGANSCTEERKKTGDTPPPATDAVDEVTPVESKEPVDHDWSDRCVSARLLFELRRHAPENMADRVDAIDEVELIDSDGRGPVYLLGDGNHIVLEATHPVVAGAVRAPDDPVARAFAIIEMYVEIVDYAVEHGDRTTPQVSRLDARRRLLESLLAGL